MSDFWNGCPYIQQDLERVKDIIHRELTLGAGRFEDILSEIRGSTGKMLRPGFFLLCSRLNNGKPAEHAVGASSISGSELHPRLYTIAAAIEMLHMASLIHDDILDEAETRRGKTALYRSYGKKKAVLAGDFIFSRCFTMVADYSSIEHARLLSKGISAICKSEVLGKTGVEETSFRSYLHRTIGKTAVLFSLSFYLGARENGVDDVTSVILRRAGYNIGIGFQIIDDILDFEGDAGTLGKPVLSDLRQGIITLPVLCALHNENGKGTLKKRLRLSHYSGRDVRTIINLVQENGGILKAREWARKYTDRALREIGKLPETQSKACLQAAGEKLLSRVY
jgi:heptaprenyl diphosphate synthase